MVAECQQDRSQIKNRETAMKILLSRLYQKQVEEQETALRRKRKLQIGSAGRSEKIRTYNFSQDRVTDHRGPTTLFNIAAFMSGDEHMDGLVASLMEQSRLEILQSMVEEFLEAKKSQSKH
jgi:peptide chain release factor 1